MVSIYIHDCSLVGINSVRRNIAVVSVSHLGNQKEQIMINGLDENLTAFVNFSREG